MSTCDGESAKTRHSGAKSLTSIPVAVQAAKDLRMNPIETEDFWEDLLDFVEQGKVIPVIGEQAVTFGDNNEPLYPWLARELVSRLNVTGERLPARPTLNDVAREHLLAGG